MNNNYYFCLKQGQDLKGSPAHLYPPQPQPPPPPQRGPSWYTVILDDLTTTNMDPCHYRSLLYSPIEDL